MREAATPYLCDGPPAGNLTDDLVSNAAHFPTAVAFRRSTARGWVDVTTEDFLHSVRTVARGLVGAGVREGDRVALMSKTRYEWTLLDYAIWCAGAVSVPIYETSPADQVEWVLADSGARAAVVETADHAARVAAVRGRLADLTQVWTLDRGGLDVLVALGAGVSDEEVERRRAGRTPQSLATLIYTSGTTGRPKGCMLTHGNFLVELGAAVDQLEELFAGEGAATLLFLPLAHVFARILQIGAVKGRVRLGHSADIRHLLADLESFRPTFLLAVPRVFENLFNTASQRAAADGRGRIFDLAADAAIAYSRALDAGRPGLRLRARHAFFDRLVYARLRGALGGRCRYAVSGGAPLGDRLGHFYRGIGLVVLEGYGLTESTGAVTVNLPEAVKIGTVGRPLAGTRLRVATDGELAVSGGQVFAGYWRDEAATRQVLDPDGWLRTGDLGEIDVEGFVRVTGRKKEILVTAGGKNVAPSVLEDRLRAHYLVGHALVVGDGRPFVAALVTIDPQTFPRWARRRGKTGGVVQHAADPDLLAEIRTAVEDANRAVSRAEAIRRFAVLPVDWTEEAGQVTPSLKLRRDVVMQQFRRDVDALYAP